ncbi:MAG: hypothetical protein KDD35_12700 [Bdellovibrionales bacterium]|nr:hypothetical protein [Bdellovibrionales bacterium]
MKYLFYIFVILPELAYSQCPIEVTSNGETYCTDITWDYGEKKIRGQFEPTETPSPYLVPMGEIPQKWIYSKAYISVWKKEDSHRAAVEIPNFRVFPYMQMKNGHHHSTAYDFFYDSASQTYVFRHVAFQSMPGCWSLRWTTASEELEEASVLLKNLTQFTNLSESQILEQELFCRSLNDEAEHEGHKHMHH